MAVRLSTGVGVGNDAQGDMLVAIKNLIGGGFNDTLIGANAANNSLNGGTGDDYLDGLSGDDTAIGGLGADRLKGGDGTETLIGGSGADQMDGGAGTTSSPTGPTGSVTVRLSTGAGTGNDAQGDTYAGIENILASTFNDILIGADGVANRIEARAGDDYLDGLSGNDTLIGGSGADRLKGGTGNDRFEFSGTINADRVLDFQGGAGAGDVLRITSFGAGLDSFAEIIAATSMIGADAVINLGGGNTITLVGVNMAALSADDFLFG